MELETHREVLIQKKQELAALEMQLQNTEKPTGSAGSGIFLFFFGLIVGLAGLPAGQILVVLLGLLLIIAGLISAVFISQKKADAQTQIDTLSRRIVDAKNKIIEIENQ